MELRAYLKFFRRRWWIIAAVFLVTIAATVFFTLRTPRAYQATASYIVGVRTTAADEKNRISALDLLSNRNEIAGTYAKIANSRTITTLAAKQLGMASLDGVAVSSQVIAGSNLLEITVTGTKPAEARDVANAIGEQTSKYVQDLPETYELRALDPAVLPTAPIRPNMAGNIILGAILGLALGVALAALIEYLQTPMEPSNRFNILDERTGIYNMQYFMLRLQQEMSRAKRSGHALSLALLNVDHGGLIGRNSAQQRIQAVRAAAAILGPTLRNEDVIAFMGEGKVAVLLADAGSAAAKSKVEKLIERLSLSPLELDPAGGSLNLHVAAGTATYRREKVGEEKSPEDLLAEAERALHEAESTTYGGLSSEGVESAAEPMSKPAKAVSTD